MSLSKTFTVQGEVHYKTQANAKWKSLKHGRKLFPGAIIETGKAAQVDLWLVDLDSIVRLTESTQIILEKLAFVQAGEKRIIEVKLNLKSGTIMGNVRKMAAGSLYEVVFPNGSCSISGTEFQISSDGVVYVVSGLAKVAYSFPGGKTFVRVVNAGQLFYPPKAAGEQPRVEPIPPSDDIWKMVRTVIP